MKDKLKTDGSKKIVIFCNELRNFQHHRSHLVIDFISNGFAVDVYTNLVGSVDSSIGFHLYPIDIQRFGFRPISDFRLFLKILNILRNESKVSIYLLHLKPYLFGSLAATVARRLGWHGKQVVAVAGLGRLYESNSFRYGKKWFLRIIVERLLKISLRQATVIFETKSDRDTWIRRGLITSAQAVVTHGAGINLKQYSQHQPSQTTCLRVLFAGRLLKSKGLPVFISAATKLGNQESTTPIKLIIAGNLESDPDAVERSAFENHPNISYLGHIDDMPKLLKETDIVVLPSLYNEGIPRILIEAGAAGCLIIATRFAGSEMLIQNLKTGIFLKGEMPDELAKNLVDWLTSISIEPEEYRHCGPNVAAYIRRSGFDSAVVSKTITNIFLDSK